MSGTVDFDVGAGTTKLAGDAFVVKLSTSGSLTWARTFVGKNGFPYDIAVDPSGNVYSTGYFAGSGDFDPGTAKQQRFILSTYYWGTYVSALDSNGNFLWAKGVGGADTVNYASSEAIALDGAGGIYVTGSYKGTVDFDPGSGTFALTSAGNSDAIVWKLDTSGNFGWAGQMGGVAADSAQGVGIDAVGNVFVAGHFRGTADFDPGSGTYELTSAGGMDGCVMKLTQPAALAASEEGGQSSSLLLVSEPTRRSLRASEVDPAIVAFAAEDRLLHVNGNTNSRGRAVG
jgi:hypothetical protein